MTLTQPEREAYGIEIYEKRARKCMTCRHAVEGIGIRDCGVGEEAMFVLLSPKIKICRSWEDER